MKRFPLTSSALLCAIVALFGCDSVNTADPSPNAVAHYSDAVDEHSLDNLDLPGDQAVKDTPTNTLGITPEEFIRRANSRLIDDNQSEIYAKPIPGAIQGNTTKSTRTIRIPFGSRYEAGATVNKNGDIDGMFFVLVQGNDGQTLEQIMTGVATGVGTALGISYRNANMMIARMIQFLHDNKDANPMEIRIINKKVLRLSYLDNDRHKPMLITVLPPSEAPEAPQPQGPVKLLAPLEVAD